MTASAVAERVQEIYGDELREDGGVVQVSSAWRDTQGILRSLKIGAHAPRSETDAFALGLARARADVIVTTGQILRHEPHLQHRIGSEAGLDFSAWRRDRLGRTQPPLVAVLTSGRSIRWDHPVFSGPSPVLLFTHEAQGRILSKEARSREVEVIGTEEPSLRALLQWLTARPAMRTVTLEVGPSSMASLSSDGFLPDSIREWMLSVCLSPSISEIGLGDPWPDLSEARNGGLRLQSDHRSEEESGPWAFQRFR